MNRFNVNGSILNSMCNGLGQFNINIKDIIQNFNLDVQNVLLKVHDFNFFLHKSKEINIFNKIKNHKNIDLNSKSEIIVESLISEDKSILKKSKTDKMKKKNELNKTINSITFKSIIEIEKF